MESMAKDAVTGIGVWEGSGAGASSSIVEAILGLLREAQETISGGSTTLSEAEARNVLARWEQSERSGRPFEHEHSVQDASGRMRIMRAIVVPVRLPGEATPKWVGLNLDVTDHIAARVTQESVTSLHETATKSVGQGTWVLQPDSDNLETSSIARDLLGLPQIGDLSFATLLDALKPVDRAAVIAMIDQARADQKIAQTDIFGLKGNRLRMMCSIRNFGPVMGVVRNLDEEAFRVATAYDTVDYPVFVLDRRLRISGRNRAAEQTDVPFIEMAEPILTQALLTKDLVSSRQHDGYILMAKPWAEGVILQAKPALEVAEDVSGVSADQLLHGGPMGAANWLSSVAPPAQAKVALDWRKALATAEPFEMPIPMSDGRTTQVKGVPIPGQAGQPARWNVTIDEANVQPSVAPTMRETIDHLRLSVEGLVSLPAPLLLQAGDRLTSSERRALYDHEQALNGIRNTLERLRMWDELATTVAHPQSVNLAALIETDPELSALKSRITEISGPAVFADPRLLRVALRELVRNSIQFGGDGPISILMTHRSLKVIDSGSGFSSQFVDQEPKIFGRGREADRINGDGLGLAIAHRIALIHGGRMIISNRIGTPAFATGAVVELIFA